MKRAVLLIAVVVFASGLAAAQDQGVTGRQFRDQTKEMRLFYSLGFVTGFSLGSASGGFGEQLAACTDKMTLGQVEAIISKFVDEHPEHWNAGIGGIALSALSRACRAR